MVVIAEGFLQYHEKRAINIALQQIPPVAPKSFLRYVDDSHSRFNDLQQAHSFQDILNAQDQHIQYTMDIENSSKTLQFLDLAITNTDGKYDFQIYRKDAITNVQVKPQSGHDPKTLTGIFNGFLHRAYTICEGDRLEEEIEFLVNCFVENGYDERKLRSIVNLKNQKRTNNRQIKEDDEQQLEQKNIVTLPWIPELSPKLRKSFKKAGFKAVFKSGANLKTMLTAKNKCKLSPHSHPGVYMVDCNCGKRYVGETSLKVSTRLQQHKKSIEDEKWDLTGITNHAQNCDEGFDWDSAKTLKIDCKKFDRKVREALEIQFQQTSPHSDHGLNQDDGQYVTTGFWKPMFSYLREKSLY